MVNIKRVYTNFKYPKLFILLICILSSYILFRSFQFQHFVATLNNYSYLGIFLAGILFSFGFTAPFSIAFFIALMNLNPVNIVDAALIGGFGALIGDIIIFETIRFTFMDEFQRIRGFHSFKTLDKVFKKSILFRFRTYLTIALAGIIIASPLPDEIGVSMLAGFTEINRKTFYLISFLLNSIGIFIILLLSTLY